MQQYPGTGGLWYKHGESDRGLDSSTCCLVRRDRNKVRYCCYWLCQINMGMKMHTWLAGWTCWMECISRRICHLSLSVRMMHGWDCRYTNQKTFNHRCFSQLSYSLLMKDIAKWHYYLPFALCNLLLAQQTAT
jgi:hypothetical protein